MSSFNSNLQVLCIPRVCININESRIRKIFDDLNMGILERIDIINKQNNKGEKFNDENIKSIRPGFGLAPKLIKQILGKKAATNLKKGTPLNLKHVARKTGITKKN